MGEEGEPEAAGVMQRPVRHREQIFGRLVLRQDGSNGNMNGVATRLDQAAQWLGAWLGGWPSRWNMLRAPHRLTDELSGRV